MIPDNTLSSTPQIRSFLPPRDGEVLPLESREFGGVAIEDGSQGLQVKIWTMVYEDGDFIIEADDVAPAVVLSGVPDVDEFQFTFDQNMRVFITYMQEGNARYWWFDSLTASQTTSTLPAGSRDVKCTFDDKRNIRVPDSDIILSYMRGDSLYFRAQRDRYTVEYLLSDQLAGKRLRQMGMNRGLRMQWDLVQAEIES